jgi:hypothetical protein
MYTPASGLLGSGVVATATDPVVTTTSDHPIPSAPVTVR